LTRRLLSDYQLDGSPTLCGLKPKVTTHASDVMPRERLDTLADAGQYCLAAPVDAGELGEDLVLQP
jgi:hypothetical protein